METSITSDILHTINIPFSEKRRVVIVGGGFAGLTVARKIAENKAFQVVLIDKNNYHQFQPLFYQVAMAGLEPSSIAFPLRKAFQENKNIFIRVTTVESITPENNTIYTPLGNLQYDYLVLAMGADTNFFGNQHIADHAIPMKSISEALFLRNTMFKDIEEALTTSGMARQELLDIVIVGGGPTGVEVAGALAEMRRHILPKDYPELDTKQIDIHLIQSSDVLLKGMSAEAGEKAEQFLTELDVIVKKNTRVKDYDGHTVTMMDGSQIVAKKVIWAAGIIGSTIKGLPAAAIGSGNRIKVNAFHQVDGFPNVFAIGDVALMSGDEKFPQGHPQVAQAAIQQGKNLAKNLRNTQNADNWSAFQYKDLGALATIGRHRAVADLPNMKTQGFFAWVIWLVVHLFAILGMKNKLFIFLNWMWNYITYDQSLRLIIKPRVK
jgi:NADH:ubiquinone reductase (H+-translocating)